MDNYTRFFSPNISKGKALENLNVLTENFYYTFLRNIALSVYEWKGLPDSMNARFLEISLFQNGVACIVNDDILGIINTRCIKGGQFNIYEECLEYTAFSLNYNKSFRRNQLALVRNNYSEYPTEYIVRLYARKLYELDRTIDTNIINQQTPLLIECDTNTRLTLINLFNKVRNHEPVIYGHKGYDLNNCISVLNTKVDFIADKLTATKLDIIAEFLTYLGINNANQQKKERLITDEVNANNEFINLSAETMLLTRQEACKEANEKFGLNISVEKRVELEIEELNEYEVDEGVME